MSDYPGGLGDGSGAYSEVILGEKTMVDDKTPAPGEVEDPDVVDDDVNDDAEEDETEDESEEVDE